MNSSSHQLLHEHPEDWSEHIPALAGSFALTVAGYLTTVELTANELAGLYLPLLHELERQQRVRHTRILAGLAGIPGSGKSTLAKTLQHVADGILGKGHFVAVGMDGWHWPNAVLDARTTRDEAGKEIPLRHRKGGPESFDVDALVRSLQALRDARGGVALPVYDRTQHEPVPDAQIVSAGTRIVLVEGNYLLSRTPPWHRVSALLLPKLFLTCDADVARERTIARHVRGGMSRQAAADKYERNDRPNADIILPDASNADLTVSLDPQQVLTRTNDETE